MQSGFDALPDWRTGERPSLVIATETGSSVPPRVTGDLRRTHSGGVEVHVIPDRDHDGLTGTAADWVLVRGFLDRLP